MHPLFYYYNYSKVLRFSTKVNKPPCLSLTPPSARFQHNLYTVYWSVHVASVHPTEHNLKLWKAEVHAALRNNCKALQGKKSFCSSVACLKFRGIEEVTFLNKFQSQICSFIVCRSQNQYSTLCYFLGRTQATSDRHFKLKALIIHSSLIFIAPSVFRLPLLLLCLCHSHST